MNIHIKLNWEEISFFIFKYILSLAVLKFHEYIIWGNSKLLDIKN